MIMQRALDFERAVCRPDLALFVPLALLIICMEQPNSLTSGPSEKWSYAGT